MARVESATEDFYALCTIATRLIPGAAPWGQFGQATILRPAAFPPNFPHEVAMPDGARLVGSCSRADYNATYVDVDESPQAVLRWYERELVAHGWYRHDARGPAGFLSPGMEASSGMLFCRGVDGPSLQIDVPGRRGTTELRMELWTNREHNPCSRSAGFRVRPRSRAHLAIPLPVLIMPEGAVLGSHGHGPALGSYEANATMTSEFDLAAISRHFAAILREAGWALERQGASGLVAWSVWTCRDEGGNEVEGFFSVVQLSGQHYRCRLLRDVSPGSRRKAESEHRAEAQRTARDRRDACVTRVEIEGPVTATTVQALRDLILHIVASPNPGLPDYAAPWLTIRTLPETLPTELSIPDGTRLLGALVLGRRTTIYMESAVLPRRLLAFYRERLAPPDWTFFGEARDRGGLMASLPAESVRAQFCPETAGPAVSLAAHVRRDGVTKAQIDVVTDLEGTPCGNASHRMLSPYRRTHPQLPFLVPPEGADFVGGGGGGSEDYCESQGDIFTDLDLPAIAAHYGTQFEDAGWNRLDGGQDGIAAWSRWTRIDDLDRRIDTLFGALRRSGDEGCSLLAYAYAMRIGDPDESASPSGHRLV